MKSFAITLEDLLFLGEQIDVPIVRVVEYQTDGTPIYGYTVPSTGFTNPLTGAAVTIDPFTGGTLPSAGAVVKLGKIGTFDLFNTAWSLFLPPVVTANGTTAAGVGEPFGIRNVQGLFNNIALSSSAIWGAAFYAFARNSSTDYDHYVQQRTGNNAFRTPTDVGTLVSTLWSNLTQAQKAIVQGNTNYGMTINANGSVDLSDRYANPFLTVYDYSPRMISQLVDSQDALLRIDAAAGGGIITDTITYDLTDINTGATKPVTESFSRNLNTLGGDPTLTGWNTLFGQFLSHGLDFIGKGGNTINGVSSKVYIPLATTDPLYRAPGTNGANDPGYTKLSISRATVDNPEAAGADGMFRTADDIQSPGVDGIYGTADDIIGATNPTYINHTSPYIDQSQTYGSDDTTTNLLRNWVLDPITGRYTPGMYLFDGNTLANAWNRQNPDGTVTVTHKTLPTLNELRAYLLATGRDDLSWGDIDNLRVRDASGKVLDLDPNTAGIQTKLTGHTLIADFLPRLDAAHINAAGLTAMSTLFPTYSGNISDYVDINSGQPTALGVANPGILGELLLRSIGDHYVAGDGRANENIGLTTVHHVWHEDHNWQIDNLINIIGQQQAADPTHTVAHAFQVKTNFLDSKGNYVYTSGGSDIAWDQEKMFQASVVIVQGEYQHVAIDQYARGMSPNIPLFVQYDSGINSDVTLEYSQMAFRFGHSQLRETIDTLDPNGSLTAAVTRYALEQAFLNPSGYSKTGPTAIAQGMTRQMSNEIDEIVTPALQQNLLGQPQDLAAINIARGRDLGLPTLNNLRRQLSAGLTTELSLLQQKLNANPGDTTLKQTFDKTIGLQAGLQAYSSWADFGNHIKHPDALVNFIAAYSFDGDLTKAEVLMKLAKGTSFSTLTQPEKDIVTNSLGWSFTSDLGYTLQANQFLNGGDQGYEAIDAWNGGLAETHVFLGELGSTFDAILALHPERADDRESWLKVGMALHSADPTLLVEWDRWSTQSAKYRLGECEYVWNRFHEDGGVTLGTLGAWAREDGWHFPVEEANRQREIVASRRDVVKRVLSRSHRSSCSQNQPVPALDSDATVFSNPCLQNFRRWYFCARETGRSQPYLDRIQALAEDFKAKTPESTYDSKTRNSDVELSDSAIAHLKIDTDNYQAKIDQFAKDAKTIVKYKGQSVTADEQPIYQYQSQVADYTLRYYCRSQKLTVERAGHLLLDQRTLRGAKLAQKTPVATREDMHRFNQEANRLRQQARGLPPQKKSAPEL